MIKDYCLDEKGVDGFLMKTYGLRIAEIELTLHLVYAVYIHSMSLKIQQGCEKSIKQINNIKAEVLELIDSFLTRTGFYQTAKKTTKAKTLMQISVWTPENRKEFITREYKLGAFFKVLDTQIDNYVLVEANLEIHGALMGVERIINLKPINFLLLIWSLMLRRRGKVDWKNIEYLLVWLSKNIKNHVLYKFYELNTVDRRYAEILRLTRNKYKKTQYYTLANDTYKMFSNRQFVKLVEFPKIIKNLKEFYQAENQLDIESWLRFNDFMICL